MCDVLMCSLLQMLQAAEEEGDIRAAKRARAEQAAELAEFDESFYHQSSNVEVNKGPNENMYMYSVQ